MLTKGWSCNDRGLQQDWPLASTDKLGLDVVCTCIYVCDTRLPIVLCQNNIILLFLGPLDDRCEAASKQIQKIEVITACCTTAAGLPLRFYLSVILFIPYNSHQVIKLHWLLALNTFTQQSLHEHLYYCYSRYLRDQVADFNFTSF